MFPRILIAALLFSLSVGTWANAGVTRIRFNQYDELIIPREYRLCSEDGECRPVPELCGFGFKAIHRDYLYDAQLALDLEQPNLTCLETVRYHVPEAACLQDVCQVIPDREGCLLRSVDGQCRKWCQNEVRCQRRSP